jgi:hypothetical protein
MVFDLCYESSSLLAANGFSYSIEALIFLAFALFAVKPFENMSADASLRVTAGIH